MRVAVAITDPALEREVIKKLRLDGYELVKRCLDDGDVRAVPTDVTIYADARFHARHPLSVLVSGSQDLPTTNEIRTHTVGVMGVSGGSGVTTIALNLAATLASSLVDCSEQPSIAAMTGQSDGIWHGVRLYTPPLAPLHSLLSRATSDYAVLDCGNTIQRCDRLIVVLTAHPISIERYLLRRREFPTHTVVLNQMTPGVIGATAKRMLEGSAHQLVIIPRDDRVCTEAFVAAAPIVTLAPKSGFTQGIKTLAGLPASRKWRKPGRELGLK